MLTGPNREIINDELDGFPIAVTWCHLCHHGVVYGRSVGMKNLIFSVSGLLWNDNLVMVDNNTGTQWSQILGKAMEGKMKGTSLERLASTITTWETWRKTHPKTTVVLLRRTAQVYDQSFARNQTDFVIGAVDAETSRAWPLNLIANERVINDHLANRPVLIVLDSESKSPFVYERTVGETEFSFLLKKGLILDEQTKSTWSPASGLAIKGPRKGTRLPMVIASRAFRETWLTFYPQTTVFGGGGHELLTAP